MNTLFVNRLTTIDNSILHPSRGLIGETWLVDIEMDGELDGQGMLLDFAEVKRSIKRIIDQEFDHKLLVPADYQYLQVAEYPEGLHLSFSFGDGLQIEHRSPRDAVRLLRCAAVTADRLGLIIGDYLSPLTPDNVSAVRVRISPERIDGAYYHYSHGLRQHSGNCQRIAHGHRSRIEIIRNGARDPTLEAEWAMRWRDIYLGTITDRIGASRREGTDYFEFGYRSAQGQFGLTLPRRSCYLIDSDSTVEHIAQHLADRLKADHPDDRFTVYAFEGIDKGAVGRA